MFRSLVLRGASAGAIALMLAPPGASAQQSLPTIDVGAATRGRSASKPNAGRGAGGVSQAGPGAPGAGSGGPPVLTPQNSYVVPVVAVGTKTDTPVMNTPLNVQSVTQKLIEDQQDIKLTDALSNISGVTTTSTAANGNAYFRGGGIFIRGFKTNTYFRDGFRVTPGAGNTQGDIIESQQLSNVSSIEVLKGPGAAMYGLSEPGGVINIVTKGPQSEPRYGVQQQIGSLALYRTTVSATGPITSDKTLLYRVDSSFEKNGAPYGYFVDLTRSQNILVSPSVKWAPAESTWLKAEFEYNNNLQLLQAPVGLTFRNSFITPPRHVNYGESSPYHIETMWAAMSALHKMNEDWSVNPRLAFYKINQNGNFTIPFLPPLITRVPVITESATYSVIANVDIRGHFDTFGAKHTFLLGGEYFRMSSPGNVVSFPPWSPLSTINAAFPVHPGVPTGFFPSSTQNSYFLRQDTVGVYLQEQIELPYNIHVMAGARYQQIFQSSPSNVTSITWIPRPRTTFAYTSFTPVDSFRVTPRFGLLWRPEEWVSFYGNYTEGFAANNGQVYPGELAPPSGSVSWEGGVKTEFFGGRLRATADYYNLIKTNVTIPDPDPTHICGGGTCYIVAGEARSKGVEFDLQGQVLPGWNIVVAYTNQDVRVTKGNPTGNFELPQGTRFPNVPRNIARLSTNYEIQDGILKGLKFGPTYTYHGSQPINSGSASQPPSGVIPLIAAWGTIDLMSSYKLEVMEKKVTAQLNAYNIFNRTYFTGANAFGGNAGLSPATANGFSTNVFRTYGPGVSVLGSLKVEF